MSGANATQIGGNHYAQGGDVQHWDFITVNGIGYLEGCATKYVARWRKKGGIEDLKKARHYVQKLRECLAQNRLLASRFLKPKITAEQFAAANGLTGVEQAAVALIAFWEDESDLAAAEEIITNMIETA